MILALHHVGLVVCSLDAAAALFRDSAGFATTSVPLAPAPLGGAVRALTLRAPNCLIELAEARAPSPGPTDRPVSAAGITHLCVQAHDIDALYARLVDAGARPFATPTLLATGTRYSYLRGPESCIVEIEGLPYAPPEQPSWVGHVAIATSDIERLAAFYHPLLGGERLGGQRIGPDPLYDRVTGLAGAELIPTWIVGSNVSLELWQYVVPPTAPHARAPELVDPGYTHLCFEVASADEAVRAWVAAGAESVSRITRHGGLATAFVRDPDGNLVELLEIDAAWAEYSVSALPDPHVVQRVAALRDHR